MQTSTKTIDVKLGKTKKKTSYAFIEDGTQTICIAPNLRNWAEDEMILSAGEFGKNDAFTKRVAGILSHETIHIVVEQLADFKTSIAIDNYFGTIFVNDDSVHGLFGVEDLVQ